MPSEAVRRSPERSSHRSRSTDADHRTRKRPRRVIRETPPSDDDEDPEMATGGGSCRVQESRAVSSDVIVLSPDRPVREVNGSNRTSVLSSGSRSQGQSGPNRIRPQTNRRHRAQLSTPNQKRSSRKLSVLTSEDLSNEVLTASITKLLERIGGELRPVKETFKSVIWRVGGEVSEKQVRDLIATKSSSSDEPEVSIVKEAIVNERDRNTNPPLVLEESPMDNQPDVESSSWAHVQNVENNFEDTRRDRPLRAHSRSNAATREPGNPLDGLAEPPSQLISAPQTIPRHLVSLDRCPIGSEPAPGVQEDDQDLMRDALLMKDWVLCADLLDLSDFARNELTSSESSSFADAADRVVRSLIDSNTLDSFASRSAMEQDKLTTIVGACARLLNGKTSEDILELFLRSLLRVQEAMVSQGRTDVLRHLVRSSASSSPRGRREALLFIWVCFANACDRGGGDESKTTLWRLLNKILSTNGAMGLALNSAKTTEANRNKLLDALEGIGCLFAASAYEVENAVVPVFLVPNWDAICLVISGINGSRFESVEKHRAALSVFLRRVCYQFADRLWKVNEALVLKVLNAEKEICVKFDEPCTCAEIPSFLTRFNSIADLRARRRSVMDCLKTESDCALFLAWVYVAQQDHVTPKISGKIMRQSMSFLKAKGVVKDRARAFTHHVGVLLAISDSFCKGPSGREDLLRSSLFSKAPSIANSSEPWISPAWASLLCAVKLRCEHLLATGQGVHLYTDDICKRVILILKQLDKPDSVVGTTVAEREVRRVQQGILVELLKEMMSALVSIVDLALRHVEERHQSSLDVIDKLLLSLSSSVTLLGNFFSGLVSTTRSSTGSGRQEVSLSILSFVEKCLELCSFQADHQIRIAAQQRASQEGATEAGVGNSPDHERFPKLVQSSMLSTLVSIVQSPVFDAGSTSDISIRCSASRALARVIGLCSICGNSIYNKGNWNDLGVLLVNARLDILEVPWFPLNPALSRTYESNEYVLKMVELLVQVEFWKVMLSGCWSSTLFSFSDVLGDIVLSLWIILWVVSFGENDESDLGKAVALLFSGIQYSAQTSENVGKWFFETNHGRSFRESDTSVSTWGQSDGRLGADQRLEALVDCFSFVLQSWAPVKVRALSDYLRRFISISGKVMTRKYEEFNASQRFFRTSKDAHDGKQALLFVQVLAVIFVIESSLKPLPQQPGRRQSIEKPLANSYLTEIFELMTKAMNKLRKDENIVGQACRNIQGLVLSALANVKGGLFNAELMVTFPRFVRLIGSSGNIRGFLCDEKENVPSFLWRYPFIIEAASHDDSMRSKYLSLLNNSRKYREQAFLTLVGDPISRKEIDSQEFKRALRCLLQLTEDDAVPLLRKSGIWPVVNSSMGSLSKRRQMNEWKRVEAVEELMNELRSSWTRISCVDNFTLW